MKVKLYLHGRDPLVADRTLVMGILNATPDSFSDGGELVDEKSLDQRIRQVINEGADILDVGGESTRPGHTKVAVDEELERVLPVIKAIRAIDQRIPISIDTQKAVVAQKALEAGASFVNDVSGLTDEAMAAVVDKYQCSIVLMQGFSASVASVQDVSDNLRRIIERATKLGIRKDQIIVDPGLGFVGPNPSLNIELIRRQAEYSQGLPVLIGASRKRFIGELTGEADPKQRVFGSVAAAVLAAEHGAAIVRVHDVRQTVESLRLLC